MATSTAQAMPVASPSGGLAQNALAGANAVFSSAVVYVSNIVPDGKTVKQEFSELVTGLSSGDFETGVRAVLKYGRGQTANVATMGIGAVSAYAKGGMAALGTFGAVLGGGLIGGFAGAYVGTWGGDWLATNVFHWNKTDINSDKPVCKGDIIAHQRKNIGLWGLAIGVLAGAAILFFGAMTFGFGLLAGFVAGSIIAAAHAMSQYGEEKGEIKEGSPDVTFEGRPVARMGDRVECRDHSHEEFIAEGVKTVTVNGRLLAKVSCRTTCDGNLDRKTETTIGVDKATATDPEKYPIRESTSLLAEFAATASIYAPWERMFGKVRGLVGGNRTQRPLNQKLIDDVKMKAQEILESGVSANERGPCLSGVYDPATGETFYAQNFKNNVTGDRAYETWLNGSPEAGGADPIVKERVAQYEAKIASGEIIPSDRADRRTAAHSEIRALDQAIKARRERGIPVDASSISEMDLYNVDLQNAAIRNNGGMPPPKNLDVNIVRE
ncbi:PAAR domain-containing protein [Aggregatibacter actinomycetemcomitans]|uniref:PAAR domain-containing protein n=1 Tax=Aggregatibacter actinomycetemcomitans TaxID=714 RepID=UPI00197C2536|nr:PAAR domain-containing protein [Aggregatibacter actinomycetemcomitans]MBN6074027.1 PAAR domain-containing protein [Aggregatibacter actinomycetemcomitans]